MTSCKSQYATLLPHSYMHGAVGTHRYINNTEFQWFCANLKRVLNISGGPDLPIPPVHGDATQTKFGNVLRG